MMMMKTMFILFISIKMSIYSGFPTRKDETLYNHLLEKLIQTMQNQLLEIVQTHGLTLSKSNLYERIISKMRQF